ncbi:MAG: IS66 family insertion sequence element accessory protein TnpA, partial [Mangrovibacterium sp.]
MQTTCRYIFCIPPSKYIFTIFIKPPYFAVIKQIELRQQEWMHKHYKAWQRRGMNHTQYCRENHIVLRQFRYWINKFEAEQEEHSVQ